MTEGLTGRILGTRANTAGASKNGGNVVILAASDFDGAFEFAPPRPRAERTPKQKEDQSYYRRWIG